MLRKLKTALRWLLALVMVSAGVLHFVAEPMFTQIVPPQLPWPRMLVWVSGAFEIVLGLALLPPGSRRLAGFGLVALFIAVFPANLYMAIVNPPLHHLPAGVAQPSSLALWLRLPFQLVLIAWALWVSTPPKRPGSAVQARDRLFRR